MKRRTLCLAATALFFLLQLGVIGGVIVMGNLTLARGVECRFRATGYDPRDPLRGRYVRFTPEVKTAVCDEVPEDGKAYFQLAETPDDSGFTPVLRCSTKPTAEGLWIGPVKTSIDYTLHGEDRRDDEDWDAFQKRRRQSPKIARALLPEKFYLPEQKALELEKQLNQKDAVGVAVYRVYRGGILLADLRASPAKPAAPAPEAAVSE